MSRGQTPAQRRANEKFAQNEERKKGKTPRAAAKYSRGKEPAAEKQGPSKIPWAFIIFIIILLLGQALYAS